MGSNDISNEFKEAVVKLHEQKDNHLGQIVASYEAVQLKYEKELELAKILNDPSALYLQGIVDGLKMATTTLKAYNEGMKDKS